MRIKNSIECYILREGENNLTEILLLHKPATNRHPAFWQPITGGMENSEEPIDACIREVKEETGIELTKECVQDMKYRFEILLEEEELFIKKKLFVTKVSIDQFDVIISSEHDDFEWIPLSEVKGKLFWESNLKTFAKILEEIHK